MPRQTIEAKLVGTSGLSLGTNQHQQSTLVFTCRKCGEQRAEVRHFGKNPAAAIKNVHRAGWSTDADGGRPICPACQEKAVQPSNNAIKGQIALIRMLDEHFDPKAGVYASGFSDAKLAEASGLKVEFVTKFREEGYGKLRNPHLEELAKLKVDASRDFDAMEMMFKNVRDDFNRRLSVLEAKVAG